MNAEANTPDNDNAQDCVVAAALATNRGVPVKRYFTFLDFERVVDLGEHPDWDSAYTKAESLNEPGGLWVVSEQDLRELQAHIAEALLAGGATDNDTATAAELAEILVESRNALSDGHARLAEEILNGDMVTRYIETHGSDEPTQDKIFLSKVRDLMGLARNAEEEAEQYAEGIRNPDLRRLAKDELER